MSDTPSRGTESLLCLVKAGSTLGSLAEPSNRSTPTSTLFATANHGQFFEFVNAQIGLNQQIIDASGIRGTQSHHATRTRFGVRSVGGQIVMQPSCADLRNLTPFWLGGTIATPALSENGPSAIDAYLTREAKDFFYSNGKCTSVSFSSSVGGILTMSMNCVFTDETVVAAGTLAARKTAASMLDSDAQSPLMHFDTSGAVLVDQSGTPLAVTPEDFSFSIDHGVMADRFRNSNTVTAMPAMDRVVSLGFTLPYNAEVAGATTLYPIPYAGYGAGKVRITYTNGDTSGVTAQFDFQVAKFNRQSPVMNGRGEIMVPFVGRAFWDGTTREFVATIDGVV